MAKMTSPRMAPPKPPAAPSAIVAPAAAPAPKAQVTRAVQRLVKVTLELPLMEDSSQRAIDRGTRVDVQLSVPESETYRLLQNALAADGTLGEGYRRTATGEPLRVLCQRLSEAMRAQAGKS